MQAASPQLQEWYMHTNWLLLLLTARCRSSIYVKSNPNQIPEIDPNVGQHRSMLIHNIHALLPYAGPTLDTAQLADENGVKSTQMVLGPLDACTCHRGRETLLIDANGVLNESEVNKTDLKDVKWEVAFEDALPSFESQTVMSSGVLTGIVRMWLHVIFVTA